MPRPAHDQRDLDFVRKYGLPVIEVVKPHDQDAASFKVGDTAYVGDGTLVNSQFLDGLDVPAAKARVIARLEELGAGRSKLTSSGSFTGRSDSGTGTVPQLAQWMTGIGQPQ